MPSLEPIPEATFRCAARAEARGSGWFWDKLLIAMASIALSLTFSPPLFGADGSAEPGEPAITPELAELVATFFHTTDGSRRTAVINTIEEVAGGDTVAVAHEIRNVQLWPALHEQEGAFAFDSAEFGPVSVAYRLPETYDPARRYPMLVCMVDDGQTPRIALALASIMCGAAIDGYLLLSPERRLSGSFNQSDDAVADLPALLREARTRFHIDGDRVFLFGLGLGADAAWIAALMHGGYFAGAVALGGYPPVPYAEQVYPFLLENLRQLPVLAVWTSPDDRRATARERTVGYHNRAILQHANRASLPITGIERSSAVSSSLNIPGETSRGLQPARSHDPRESSDDSVWSGILTLAPPADAISRLLEHHRPPPGSSASHWFRYPAQAHSRWLRQDKFQGDPWEDDQLSILPYATTDRDRFITEVIQEKLAYLGGGIDGQTIVIEARRCARVEVLLPNGVVDFAQPVTIHCNGKRRYEGLVQPSIRTMLETAHEEWEFQHPPLARLSFSIKPSKPRR